MNTTQYILKSLEELGVKDFFGYIGKYNINIKYEIEANTALRWISCNNPLNAAFASDGYARINGIGTLITSYATNEHSTIGALIESIEENIPVVYILMVPNTEQKIIKSLEIFKNVCSTFALLTKDNAKLEIDRVLKTLVKERKPVYIVIPEDVGEYKIVDKKTSYDWLSDNKSLEKAVSKALEKINASSKPIVLCGGLVKRFASVIEYREFVTKSGIPVFSFQSGLSITDIVLPNYIGLYSKDNNYIKETDCRIVIGALEKELNEVNINDNQIIISGNTIIINGEKYENIKMSEFLDKLSLLVNAKHIELNKSNFGFEKLEPSSDNLSLEYFYSRLQEFIMENDIIITDTNVFGNVLGKLNLLPNVKIEYLRDNIGQATPSALGANILRPNTRVILITDAKSHSVSCMEVGTMLQYGLKPIIIVIKNILSKENIDSSKLNYAKFARVFEGDVWSAQVKTSDDFDRALKVTRIMNKMCYIETCMEIQNSIVYEKKSKEKYINKNENKKNNRKSLSLEKVSLSFPINGNKYETVVHQVFNEYDETEEIQ